MKFYQSKEFKTLSQEWDEKIKESGLNPPYDVIHPELAAKLRVPRLQLAAQSYTAEIEELLHSGKLKEGRETIIWGLFCRGLGFNQISACTGYKREHVKRVIRLLKDRHGITKNPNKRPKSK